MKRIALLLLIICCFFFAGCGQKLSMGESIYDGKFIVSGVGPEIGFEPTVDDGTLVLKGYFEDHSDHIFLNKGIWEKYMKEESDYLPGNIVRFKGVLKYLDGAAGNHYYEVKSIDELKVVEYPDADEIKEIFDSYNYCENDSDCGYFMGECPLGCYIPLNVKYTDVASNIVANFVNHLDERCVYDCIEMNKARCENYKCEMYDAEASEDVHACGPVDNDPELSCDDGGYDLVCANDGKTYKNSCFACKEPLVETFTFGQCKNDLGVSYCTAYQKSADVCTMEYAPVCGSDSRTYGNSCAACQSETVESYTQGECENSAFVVEGDPENLSYLMGTFEKSVL